MLLRLLLRSAILPAVCLVGGGEAGDAVARRGRGLSMLDLEVYMLRLWGGRRVVVVVE